MTCVEGEDLTKLCKGIIRPVKCPECDNNGRFIGIQRQEKVCATTQATLILTV
jgi:hypothetical protein